MMKLTVRILGMIATFALASVATCEPLISDNNSTSKQSHQAHTFDGVKVIVLLHRKPGMSLQAFHEYWSTTHAALFDGAHPTAKKYIKRYVQSTPLGALYGEQEPPYDGMAEVYFASKEALFEFLETEYYQKTVRPDELKFIDRTRIVEIITTEHTFAIK